MHVYNAYISKSSVAEDSRAAVQVKALVQHLVPSLSLSTYMYSVNVSEANSML